jgi:hypothetical protein
MCLTIHDVGKTGYTVWDIVTGKLQQLKDKKKKKRIRIRMRMRMTVKKRMTK